MLGDPGPDRPEADESFGDCGWTVKVSKGVCTHNHSQFISKGMVRGLANDNMHASYLCHNFVRRQISFITMFFSLCLAIMFFSPCLVIIFFLPCFVWSSICHYVWSDHATIVRRLIRLWLQRCTPSMRLIPTTSNQSKIAAIIFNLRSTQPPIFVGKWGKVGVSSISAIFLFSTYKVKVTFHI